MKSVLNLVLLSIALHTGFATAETVDVGGTRIVIPAPGGYANITNEDALFSEWQKDTHVTARLLAGYMGNADFEAWRQDPSFVYGSYNAMANVDKAMQSMPANSVILNALYQKSKTHSESTMPPAFIEGSDGTTLNPALTADAFALVGTYQLENAFYMIMLAHDPQSSDLLQAEAQVLVGNRVIGLSMGGYYRDQDDLDWLHNAVESWAASIQAAN